MKTVFHIIVLFAVFLYIADTTIQIKPFKISFGNLSAGFAWFFFLLAFIFMTYSVHKKAYSEGLKKGCEISREAAVEVAKEIIEKQKKSNKCNIKNCQNHVYEFGKCFEHFMESELQ